MKRSFCFDCLHIIHDISIGIRANCFTEAAIHDLIIRVVPGKQSEIVCTPIVNTDWTECGKIQSSTAWTWSKRSNHRWFHWTKAIQNARRVFLGHIHRTFRASARPRHKTWSPDHCVVDLFSIFTQVGHPCNIGDIVILCYTSNTHWCFNLGQDYWCFFLLNKLVQRHETGWKKAIC